MSECKCVAQQASYLTTAENFFGKIFRLISTGKSLTLTRSTQKCCNLIFLL